MRSQPTRRDVEQYFKDLSNWGRWGNDDELGTLNLITPQVRRRAVALVSEGFTVPLSDDLDPAKPDPLGRGSTLQRYMMLPDPDHGRRRSGAREWVGMVLHGSPTHLDALSHQHWDGHMYNGVPVSALTSRSGATKLSIHTVREGVVTRGVLLDIAALRQTDWLEPGEPVYPDDLEAAEKRQGSIVREGDALMIYTGHRRRIEALGLDPKRRSSGYHASCLPWLHSRGVAVLSSEAVNDVHPSGYGPADLTGDLSKIDPDEFDFMEPVHSVGLVAMGLWLVDNMNLSELSVTCARLNRWEFLFVMAPLRIVGATASPVNALAIL